MNHNTTDMYRIELYRDPTFSKDSADSANHYDFVYFEKSDYDFLTIIGVKVFQDDILIKSAVMGSIGGGTGIHATSAIVENDRLVVCCSDTVFCLSIPELTLLWRTRADEATCFEIYSRHNSYIVHGELQITRIDKVGNILWQQSGADIFTTHDGKDSFVITDTYILATDWENRKYKFDFDGRRLQ
ncbi:MAG: hypothetical protein ACYC1Q_10600 [Bacteroidia bacterium]